MDPLHLSIRNDSAEFTRVMDEVDDYLARARVPQAAGYTVHLVIEELVRNVQRHAYGEHRLDGIVVLEVQATPDAVRIVVEDDGPEFDPTTGPDPDVEAPIEERTEGGLGVFLVRAMADEIAYERADDRNRVRVRIAVGS